MAFGGALHVMDEYALRQVACEGPSMEPTIADGTGAVVLVERFSHRIYGLEKSDGVPPSSSVPSSLWETVQEALCRHFFSGIDRGDVVIMRHPSREGTICKRVVGMPGDAVARNDGWENEDDPSLRAKWIDDVADDNVENSSDGDGDDDDWVHVPAGKNHRNTFRNVMIVPPGHFWIEGDNPTASSDSRYYGAIPASLIVGKVVCRIWPPVQKKNHGYRCQWHRILGGDAQHF